MTVHAHKHLRKRDARLAEWIDRLGPLNLPTPPVREPYVALLEAIAHQQLAGAAARAIWARVVGLFDDGVPCSKRMAQMTEERLRSAGLSRSKALAMKDICDRVNSGKIPNATMMATMPDAKIYEALLEARGVGTWTVDMLMMFTLCRPDVMPVTDYGVRKGFQVLYRKRALPTPKQLLKHSEIWQPHRTVAALYLWRIAESAKKPRRTAKKAAKKKAKKKSLSK
jgi:3-methyladenine DNA glycosylase/8-oxoguanine DNA glycosylase